MSGLGLISDYNNDSEDVSDSEDKKGKSKQSRTSEKITGKLTKISQDSGKSNSNNRRSSIGDESRGKHDSSRSDRKNRDDKYHDGRRDEKNRDDRPRDKPQERSRVKSTERSLDKSLDKSREKSSEKSIERSRDKSRERSSDKSSDKSSEKSSLVRSRDGRHRGDRSGYDDKRRSDKRHHSDRSRGSNNRDRGDRERHRKHQFEKEREYDEYRKRRYGDSREWGKVSAESLKDVKTDATLPTSFDSTIAKQLAAQREKRKLLWGKKEGEGSTDQKSVWGSGSLRNDESGEQTVKFLKLMGVKDVNEENVKEYKKTDDSVLKSSQAVDSMETEYEKSRYLQHMNKGVGLGMVQFTNTQPPT